MVLAFCALRVPEAGDKFDRAPISRLLCIHHAQVQPFQFAGIQVFGLQRTAMRGMPGVEQVLPAAAQCKCTVTRAHQLRYSARLVFTTEKGAAAMIKGFAAVAGAIVCCHVQLLSAC